jgi:hypothetical protein
MVLKFDVEKDFQNISNFHHGFFNGRETKNMTAMRNLHSASSMFTSSESL